jgi:hypothetical protein
MNADYAKVLANRVVFSNQFLGEFAQSMSFHAGMALASYVRNGPSFTFHLRQYNEHLRRALVDRSVQSEQFKRRKMAVRSVSWLFREETLSMPRPTLSIEACQRLAGSVQRLRERGIDVKLTFPSA